MLSEAVIRPASGRLIAAALVLLAAGIVILGTVQLGVLAMIPHYAAPLLIGYIGWFAFWAPTVRVSPGEVVIDNPTRVTRLEWAQITRIDTKWALEVYTQYGKTTAWAAAAPGRHAAMRQSRSEVRHLPNGADDGTGSVRPGDIPTSDSGAAATVIRRQWEQLRDAGHLEGARPEFERPRTSVHWVRLAVLAALIALVVVSAL